MKYNIYLGLFEYMTESGDLILPWIIGDVCGSFENIHKILFCGKKFQFMCCKMLTKIMLFINGNDSLAAMGHKH